LRNVLYHMFNNRKINERRKKKKGHNNWVSCHTRLNSNHNTTIIYNNNTSLILYKNLKQKIENEIGMIVTTIVCNHNNRN
jgi:hypothetical protein